MCDGVRVSRAGLSKGALPMGERRVKSQIYDSLIVHPVAILKRRLSSPGYNMAALLNADDDVITEERADVTNDVGSQSKESDSNSQPTATAATQSHDDSHDDKTEPLEDDAPVTSTDATDCSSTHNEEEVEPHNQQQQQQQQQCNKSPPSANQCNETSDSVVTSHANDVSESAAHDRNPKLSDAINPVLTSSMEESEEWAQVSDAFQFLQTLKSVLPVHVFIISSM